MINFPVIQSITFQGYLLYPCSMQSPFHIPFLPGPSLIAGVNGSGKSTLIGAALRLLTGPYDLPSSTTESELGQVRHKPVALSRYDRQTFARRVADGAVDAVATIEIILGDKHLSIKRTLSDLSLLSVLVDGEEILFSRRSDEHEDATYHRVICENVGIGSFFDFLIILQYITFMLEDRRALVWDSTVQRQIYRILLLSKERAGTFASVQQELISADSALRNAQSLISRQQKNKAKATRRAGLVPKAEAEMRVKSAQVSALRERLESLAAVRVEADAERRRGRLDKLKAIEVRDSYARELERLKLNAVSHWLSPDKDTARYIIGQLLSEDLCLVCGTHPAPVKETVEKRIKDAACPFCGTVHAIEQNIVHTAEVDAARIQQLEGNITLANAQIEEAQERLFDAQERLISADDAYRDVESEVFDLEKQIIALLKEIPSERSAIRSVDSEVATLERIVETERDRRTKTEKQFRDLVTEMAGRVASAQKTVNDSFVHYTSLFLKEEARLVYQTVEVRVGQGGSLFAFPMLKLDMSSGAKAGTSIRNHPNEVSQSQAEFVDLAFRMALMTTLASDQCGTLVVDAPEASLDFLFAERAGTQLSSFSYAGPRNRVIATSYLPSKHFVSSFLVRVKEVDERKKRVVDLIRYAAENAALRANKPQYEQFLDELISGE
ncbi:AAA family ATPase [Rhodocista pekingensis]|uniref:AAA family ATPase n=1 Tax=Rhodocista pekingensis TaxID=201185 RepID=A0ABW2KZT7_9PROT